MEGRKLSGYQKSEAPICLASQFICRWISTRTIAKIVAPAQAK